MTDPAVGTPVRIAYVTMRDPDDRKSWSGTLYYMAQALEKHCGEVFRVGPLLPTSLKIGRLLRHGVRILTGREYLYTHTLSLSKTLGMMAEEKMEGERLDAIVAVAASGIVAHLRTRLPIIYLSDTTVRLMIDYNVEFSNVLASHIRTADQLEQQSIRKANRFVYPSQWAAQSAVEHYGAAASNVTVIPFGANLDHPPTREQALTDRVEERCRLLFVGVNWEQKGGDIAVETLLELKRLGVPSELSVVGCRPPRSTVHPDIRVFPFLDKKDPAQRAKLESLYSEASFLIFPTRAECFGIVSCEANAYGLPVLATATGGIPGAVREGINGFLFSHEARGREYASRIYHFYNSREAYLALRASSRREFESRLNWDSWGKSISPIINSVVGRSARCA